MPSEAYAKGSLPLPLIRLVLSMICTLSKAAIKAKEGPRVTTYGVNLPDFPPRGMGHVNVDSSPAFAGDSMTFTSPPPSTSALPSSFTEAALGENLKAYLANVVRAPMAEFTKFRKSFDKGFKFDEMVSGVRGGNRDSQTVLASKRFQDLLNEIFLAQFDGTFASLSWSVLMSSSSYIYFIDRKVPRKFEEGFTEGAFDDVTSLPPDSPIYSFEQINRLALHALRKSFDAPESTATAVAASTNSDLWSEKFAPDEHGLVIGNEHAVEFMFRWLRKWTAIAQSIGKGNSDDGVIPSHSFSSISLSFR